MFVIGAILIVLAIIVVIYVTFATRSLDPLTIDWGPFTAALTPLQLFFLGAVTILVLAIGAVMFSIGLKSQGAKRAEVKQLRKEIKAGQADKSDPSTDSSRNAKGSPKASVDSSPPGRGEVHGGRDADASGSSADGSPSGGSATSTPPAPAKSTGPKLPPPVVPRDSSAPPRTGSL